MRHIIIAFLLIVAMNCYSAVYQYQSNSGSTVYTDNPSNSTTEVSVPKPETVPAQTIPPSTSEKTNISQSKTEKKPYTTFEISSPKDQETMQNQPTITVSFKIEPELQSGDKIQLFIDGKPNSIPTTNSSIVLEHIDRGAHQLYATLLEDQKILKQTSSITIYVHYGHIN